MSCLNVYGHIALVGSRWTHGRHARHHVTPLHRTRTIQRLRKENFRLCGYTSLAASCPRRTLAYWTVHLRRRTFKLGTTKKHEHQIAHNKGRRQHLPSPVSPVRTNVDTFKLAWGGGMVWYTRTKWEDSGGRIERMDAANIPLYLEGLLVGNNDASSLA